MMTRNLILPIVGSLLGYSLGVRAQNGTCVCSPTGYRFTFDFDSICTQVEEGNGIAFTVCQIDTLGGVETLDLKPASIDLVTVVELDEDNTAIRQENFSSFVDGDSFEYQSSLFFDPSAVPTGIQLNVYGSNAAGDELSSFVAVSFTKDCSVYPVFPEGFALGWVQFGELVPPLEGNCDALDDLSTLSPTPTNITLAPTVAQNETVSPTAFNETTAEPTVGVLPTQSPTTVVPVPTTAEPVPVTTVPVFVPVTTVPVSGPVTTVPVLVPVTTAPITLAPVSMSMDPYTRNGDDLFEIIENLEELGLQEKKEKSLESSKKLAKSAKVAGKKSKKDSGKEMLESPEGPGPETKKDDPIKYSKTAKPSRKKEDEMIEGPKELGPKGKIGDPMKSSKTPDNMREKKSEKSSKKDGERRRRLRLQGAEIS